MTIRFNSEIVATAYRRDQFPDLDLPEIAVAGRSNVGKSSLINSFLGKKIARVAAQPGKTRSINFMKVSNRDMNFVLVDLPGYGFAARSKKERDEWARLIEGYLLSRSSLVLVISLVDFRHGLMDSDLQLQEWIGANNIPYHVVFTKIDKIARGKRKQLLLKYVRSGLKSLDVPNLTSAVTGDGLPELRSFVCSYLKDIGQLAASDDQVPDN